MCSAGIKKWGTAQSSGFGQERTPIISFFSVSDSQFALHYKVECWVKGRKRVLLNGIGGMAPYRRANQRCWPQ
jgi:hypothetical protein